MHAILSNPLAIFLLGAAVGLLVGILYGFFAFNAIGSEDGDTEFVIRQAYATLRQAALGGSMQIKVTVKQTVEAELDSRDLGYAIKDYLIQCLPCAERENFDDGVNDWVTDDAGNVYIGWISDWRPFAEIRNAAVLVDAINVLMGHGLLKMPADPKPTLYEAYPAQCPNGHDGATYIPEIEAVRCPVCGLSDVSA